MATTLQILKRFEALSVDQVTEDAFEQSEKPMKEKQTSQMMKGVNKLGEQIGKYRNPAYARKKNAMNPLPGYGIPDLKLSGAFHRQVYAETRGDKIILDSTDPKTQKLVDKYGEEIFGLNQVSKVEFIKESLRPTFLSVIRKALKP